jgi:hypothetical protein
VKLPPALVDVLLIAHHALASTQTGLRAKQLLDLEATATLLRDQWRMRYGHDRQLDLGGYGLTEGAETYGLCHDVLYKLGAASDPASASVIARYFGNGLRLRCTCPSCGFHETYRHATLEVLGTVRLQAGTTMSQVNNYSSLPGGCSASLTYITSLPGFLPEPRSTTSLQYLLLPCRRLFC